MGASVSNACLYNNGLTARLAQGVGTPRVRGPIGVYIFESFDELNKPIDMGAKQALPYWGTLQENGNQKYPLDWKGAPGNTAMCP